MRVAYVVGYLSYGGLQQVVLSLAHGLKKLGHHVEIYCVRKLGNHPEAVAELTAAGIPVTAFEKPGGWRSMPGFLSRVVPQMKAAGFDVLHSHNPVIHHHAALAGRLAGIPVVMNTLHAMLVMDRIPPIRRTYFRAAAMQTDCIISVCTQVQEHLEKYFSLPPSKLAVIENGIPLDRFLALPLRPLGSPVVFGNVARLSGSKNHELLIRAFHLLRQKYPQVRLRILGGGQLLENLSRLTTELGVDNDVKFLGYSHDVPAFLAGLDVFVLSSNGEGLPLSLLEAIAAGLPAVVTQIAGMPEVIRKTNGGWVCPPADPPAMMLAMEKALLDPERQQRQVLAKESVAKEYGVQRMTEDHINLYNKYLNRQFARGHE